MSEPIFNYTKYKHAKLTALFESIISMNKKAGVEGARFVMQKWLASKLRITFSDFIISNLTSNQIEEAIKHLRELEKAYKR